MTYSKSPPQCKGLQRGWNAVLTWYRPPKPRLSPDPDDFPPGIKARIFFSVSRPGSWGEISILWRVKTFAYSIATRTVKQGRLGSYYYPNFPAGWVDLQPSPDEVHEVEFPYNYSTFYLEDGTPLIFNSFSGFIPIVDDPGIEPRINPYTGYPSTLYHHDDYPGTKLLAFSEVMWAECWSNDISKVLTWVDSVYSTYLGTSFRVDALTLDPANPNTPPSPSGGYGGNPPETQNIKEVLPTRRRDSLWQIDKAAYIIDRKHGYRYAPVPPSGEHRLLGLKLQFCGCGDNEHECGDCCLSCCDMGKKMLSKFEVNEWR